MVIGLMVDCTARYRARHIWTSLFTTSDRPHKNLDAKYIASILKERLFIMAVQCFIDWLCYVGVYVTVFSILCSLSSFLFFLICLVAIILLMNKDVYKTLGMNKRQTTKHIRTMMMRTSPNNAYDKSILLIDILNRCWLSDTTAAAAYSSNYSTVRQYEQGMSSHRVSIILESG